MKVLRVSEPIHEHLKEIARREGRTLQWIVEELLSRDINNDRDYVALISTPAPEPVKESPPTFMERAYEDIADYQASIHLPRDKQITQEIKSLEAEIELADPMNQDPDYWEVIQEKKNKVQNLWTEWHQLTGR